MMASQSAWHEGPGKLNYAAQDLRAEWKRWSRGFKTWLIGTERDKKKEEVKLSLLLTMMGSEGQDVFETFDFDEGEQTLDAAMTMFEAHFAGTANVTMTRFRFFGYTQDNHSFAEFLTGLKSLANDCEFGELRDSLIKDMIVLHCGNSKLRERLLRETKLDLARAVGLLERPKRRRRTQKSSGVVKRVDSAWMKVQWRPE